MHQELRQRALGIDADKWPDLVKISKWYFKSNFNGTVEDKRRRLYNADATVNSDRMQSDVNDPTVAAAVADKNGKDVIESDMDATILQDESAAKSAPVSA